MSGSTFHHNGERVRCTGNADDPAGKLGVVVGSYVHDRSLYFAVKLDQGFWAADRTTFVSILNVHSDWATAVPS